MVTLDFTVHCSTEQCENKETFAIDVQDIDVDLNSRKLCFHIPTYDKGWKTETVSCFWGDGGTYYWCPDCAEEKQ